jgi:hypothetical protein
LDEENPTYAGLSQENGFGSASLLAHVAVAGKTRCSGVHLQKRV